MNKTKTLGGAGDSSYTLIISGTEVKLDCYLKGGIAGVAVLSVLIRSVLPTWRIIWPKSV